MDINNVKKQTRDLKNKIHKPEDRPPVDWCYYLDSSNWIRSVLAPSTFGEYISKLDDFEVREFCRKFGLHSDTDIIKFAIDNTEFTINGLFGL